MPIFLFDVLAGEHGQEQQNVHGASTTPVVHDDGLMQPPQLELVGHSIVSV